MFHFFLFDDSESHPGVPETSNSPALELARLGLAFGAAIAGFPDGLDAPAAAADVTGFAATDPVLLAPAGLTAGFAASPGFAFPLSGSLAFPRPSAWSTEARRSTSMRNGDPEEYSA